MRLFLVLRFSIATAFLGAALTFIANAVKSWNNTPSVTSGELILESYDQSIASTKTKYIKPNTKTQIFF